MAVFATACTRDPPVRVAVEYDIFLVAGQSNTHQGAGLDLMIDQPQENIRQLGRGGANDLKVILATEPLQHWTALANEIGFCLTFAKAYAASSLKEGRQVLLIPCGYGETGFASGHWNKGEALYEDAVQRTRYALSLSKNNRLVAVLWHQGESDVGWPQYQQALHSMIGSMRSDIAGHQQVPFVLGGMVPYWVAQDSARMHAQSVIAGTPSRVSMTAFASPYYPTVITKADSTFVPVHYDAAGQRVLGKRYFAVLDSLLNL